MAVIYETQGNIVKAYSDQGLKIHGGFPEADYAVAYDPVGANRVYTETDEYIDTQPTPSFRAFSKLKLESALFQAGALSAVDAFIDAQNITNEFGQQLPLRRFYNTANEFHDDHPLFTQYIAALQQHLGWTDVQVEAILAASEV